MKYALGVVSSVRAEAERRGGRQVGMAGLGWKRSARVRAVVATLLWEGPPPWDTRQPIQRKHLLQVNRWLRMKENGVNRVGWAVRFRLV